MDVGAFASAMIGAWVGRLQVAAAATMLQTMPLMGAEGANLAAELIDSAQQNFDRLANVAAGIGRNLDISV